MKLASKNKHKTTLKARTFHKNKRPLGTSMPVRALSMYVCNVHVRVVTTCGKGFFLWPRTTKTIKRQQTEIISNQRKAKFLKAFFLFSFHT